MRGLSAQTLGVGRQTLARLCGAKATGTVHAAAAVAAVAARGGCSAARTVHCNATTGFFARQATADWTQAGMPPALARTLRVHVMLPVRAMTSPASGSAGSIDKTDKVKHEVSPRRVSSNLNQTSGHSLTANKSKTLTEVTSHCAHPRGCPPRRSSQSLRALCRRTRMHARTHAGKREGDRKGDRGVGGQR